MADWPYSTTTWRKLRLAKLAASPMCEACARRGVVTPARHVDHVRAVSAGGDPFPPLDGLAALCPSCHSRKTAAMDRPGGKGAGWGGVGLDGLPVDPDHPFLTGNQGDTPSKDGRMTPRDRLGARARTKFPPGRRQDSGVW